MRRIFSAIEKWYRRVAGERPEAGATTLEYVIIAAIVCGAAVIVATLIVAAINNFGAQIPTG